MKNSLKFSIILAYFLLISFSAQAYAPPTGTGLSVYQTSPVLITPNLGTPSALVCTNCSGTASALNIGGNAATSTSATTATNANNVATTSTSSNATFYPLFVSSTANSNQAADLNSSFNINPSTGVLSATSFTGAGTGLTGTGASFTSGSVTTNANLTGVITSSGNATSIASQTGTGTKFVVDTTPTLITPVLGVATGTGLILTGTSANIFAAGPSGSSNPAFNVDASTGSSATGVNIKSAAAGGGVVLSAISSGSTEALTISTKGDANLTLKVGGTSSAFAVQLNAVSRFQVKDAQTSFTPDTATTASNARFLYTGPADTNLTLSTEAPSIYFNQGQTRQHATGSLTTQRDFRITGSTHSFVGASTLTNAAAFAVDGPISAGTNATITNSFGIYIPTLAVSGTVTNAYAASFAAPSGGGTTNAALNVTDGTRSANFADGTNAITATGNISLTTAGNGLIIKSGSNARIGTGTLTGGTVTVSNTSVTANTRVFLTDTTSGSLANVGNLAVVTSAGSGFTVTSTNVLDTSTFNWMLVESQ